MLLAEGEDHVTAREAFREAVRLRPDFLLAWCGLGLTCAALGDEAERRTVETRLQEIDPTLAARFRETCARGLASASLAPLSGGPRLRSTPDAPVVARLASSFEAWLKSLPLPPRRPPAPGENLSTKPAP
jgi:hypothetical protein